MNNLAYLFDEDKSKNENGVRTVTVPAYQTSDGTIFNNKKKAEAHEANEQLVKNLVKKYQHWNNSFRVGGWTMRGNGDEFVTADHQKLEAYTRYVINQIKG